eukprot:1157418-Pelagomonas_calceolata.AAC.6
MKVPKLWQKWHTMMAHTCVCTLQELARSIITATMSGRHAEENQHWSKVHSVLDQTRMQGQSVRER